MIFKITKEGDFFEDNPTAYLIDDFKKINSRDMKYISLVYDYDSMLCNMPIYERKLRALELLEYDTNKDGNWPKNVRDMIEGNSDKFVDAVRAFRGLMSDTDKETLAAYVAQLKECQRLLKKPNKSPSEINASAKMFKDMEQLRALIHKLKDELRQKAGKDAFSSDDIEEESLSLVEEINNLEDKEN
jgi:hypothetical protein